MFEYDIKVRGFHLDLYQHVNNARYLEFLEESRWAMFENQPLIKTLMAKNLSLQIVNININYKASAVLGDTITVQNTVERIGNKSCTFLQKIINKEKDTEIIEAQVTFCLVDGAQHKAVPIDDEALSFLEGL